MIKEIDEFLGESRGENGQEIQDREENMDIDGGTTEPNRILQVRQTSNNTAKNQNASGNGLNNPTASSSLLTIQNMEQHQAQVTGASTSSNFDVNRRIPQFLLQSNDASRNRSLAPSSTLSQSGINQQVITNRSIGQPSLPQEGNGHAVNGAQVFQGSNRMRLNLNNQQGAVFGTNEMASGQNQILGQINPLDVRPMGNNNNTPSNQQNVAPMQSLGNASLPSSHQNLTIVLPGNSNANMNQANAALLQQQGIQGFAAGFVNDNITPPGNPNANVNQANAASVQQQGIQGFGAGFVNAKIAPQGVLVARNGNANRVARRAAPYAYNAIQIRRQNFDNLANLLWSLSKKFSYVRNPDQYHDENDPI